MRKESFKGQFALFYFWWVVQMVFMHILSVKGCDWLKITLGVVTILPLALLSIGFYRAKVKKGFIICLIGTIIFLLLVPKVISWKLGNG